MQEVEETGQAGTMRGRQIGSQEWDSYQQWVHCLIIDIYFFIGNASQKKLKTTNLCNITKGNQSWWRMQCFLVIQANSITVCPFFGWKTSFILYSPEHYRTERLPKGNNFPMPKIFAEKYVHFIPNSIVYLTFQHFLSNFSYKVTSEHAVNPHYALAQHPQM